MKEKYYSGLVKYIVLLADILLLWIVCEASQWTLTLLNIPFNYQTDYYIIFALSWVTAGLLNKIYRINQLSSVKEISFTLINSFLVHMIVIAFILNILPELASWTYVGTNFFILISLVIWSRVGLKLVFKYLEFSFFDTRKAIIVGTTKEGMELSHFFTRHRSAGYLFLGFFDDLDRSDEQHIDIKGDLAQVKSFCLQHQVEEVYFALPLEYSKFMDDLRDFCDDNTIYFRIAPDFSDVIRAKYQVFLYDSLPVLTVRNEPLGVTLNVLLKRIFDIVFSSFVILFVFPIIFPIIVLAIKLDSPGPVFFKQLRPGKYNRLFECYKFRTMYINDQTELQATKNDSRVTKVGRFLRKTNLDELPQFFNVLLGSMSVVGPRPNLVSQLDTYSKIVQKYKVRHFITPGITGYAQVNGYRGETRDNSLMEKRVEYDVKYIENWSFLLDLKIIFLTVYNMFKGEKNAY